jgi:3-hydroxyacyl-[acyl-carrier-protein] dehydratase
VKINKVDKVACSQFALPYIPLHFVFLTVNLTGENLAMLLNSFYTIKNLDGRDEINAQGVSLKHYRADLILDPSHSIFGGHFPGNPVVPGVCQVQMILETMSSITGRRLKLTESDNIKFLSMINPLDNSVITLDLVVKPPEEGRYSIQASLSANDTTFLKFKGKLVAE